MEVLLPNQKFLKTCKIELLGTHFQKIPLEHRKLTLESMYRFAFFVILILLTR